MILLSLAVRADEEVLIEVLLTSCTGDHCGPEVSCLVPMRLKPRLILTLGSGIGDGRGTESKEY